MSIAIDQLRPVLLVGTRGGATVPNAVDLLPTGGAAESQLLRLAGAAALRRAAGVPLGEAPKTDEDAPAAAPPDERPECSREAADTLVEVIDLHEPTLLREWLTLCDAASQRVPHKLIPLLLEQARRSRAIRPLVDGVIDQRGRWLATLNKAWRVVGSSDGKARDVFKHGTLDARLIALRTIREDNPAEARELLAASWKQEKADARARFVALLRIGLSPEDEPWLASVQNDRSAAVVEAISDLLLRLPGSDLVRRATERLDALLDEKQAKKLFTFELPKSYDDDLKADGIAEKPPTRVGKRQWWLLQLLGRVPPTHWLEKLKVDAKTLVKRIDPTLAVAIGGGLAEACNRFPNPAVAAALATQNEARERLDSNALAGVPDDDLVRYIDAMRPQDAYRFFAAFDTLPPKASRAAVEWAKQHKVVPDELPVRVEPSVLPLLEEVIVALMQTTHLYGGNRVLQIARTRRTLRNVFG